MTNEQANRQPTQVGYWASNGRKEVWINAGTYPLIEAHKVAAELRSRGFEVDLMAA